MRTEKVLKLAKGYYGRAKNCPRIALTRVEKALQHQYKDRKIKKRDFRKQWIQTVNAGAREHGMSYNLVINALHKQDIQICRKTLADLARHEPFSFRSVVEVCKMTEGPNRPDNANFVEPKKDWFEPVNK
mmetsp:Transcript_8170/g.13190  ORF Transcript_8170/g.13190 Transcript_8170/m.13190 type:complete len:130 (-) Transcript_8170:133-522(-)